MAIAESLSQPQVATVSLDGVVTPWDMEGGSIVAEIEVVGSIGDGLHGVAFLKDETLAVAPESGRYLFVYSLDAETLIDQARDAVNRGFTDAECLTYQIDPCPTTVGEVKGLMMSDREGSAATQSGIT